MNRPRPLDFVSALILSGLILLPVPVGAVGLPIQIDGDYADWGPGAEIGTDPAGDNGSSGIDFTALQVADDTDWVYFHFDTTVEVQPDEGQNIVFALDTDQNPATGLSVGGIGAELVWRLGDRTGFVYPSGVQIDHPEIGLVPAPTVSDTEFEFALSRGAAPNGSALFPGPGFDIYLWDDAGGDAIGPYGYAFSGESQTIDSRSLAREDPAHLRLGSYNVLNDGLFEGGARSAAFERLFGAIDPDVWVFCEVWNHDAAQTAARVEELLPSGEGESWYAIKRDQGNVVVSRFPILNSWDVLPGSRVTAVLLDLRPALDSDLLLIANHWSCCTADQNRQEQADAIVAFLRDARTTGGLLDLAPDTPMLAAGDFNLVGWRQQRETLETGDIVDEGTFGADSPPDWDGSNFDRAEIRHADARFVYTWRNDASSFYPGQLDYIWYSGSAAELHRNLTVDTRTMLPATLAAHGLQAGDTETASDHSPIFADFSLGETSGVGGGAEEPGGSNGDAGGAGGSRGPDGLGDDWSGRPGSAMLTLLPSRPSPFRDSIALRFLLEQRVPVDVVVFDARGREVRRLYQGTLSGPGVETVDWDGRDGNGYEVPSGVYGYVVRAGGESLGGAVVRLR